MNGASEQKTDATASPEDTDVKHTLDIVSEIIADVPAGPWD